MMISAQIIHLNGMLQYPEIAFIVVIVMIVKLPNQYFRFDYHAMGAVIQCTLEHSNKSSNMRTPLVRDINCINRQGFDVVT